MVCDNLEYLLINMCVCACVRACVCACARVRVCMYVCMLYALSSVINVLHCKNDIHLSSYCFLINWNSSHTS